MLFLLPLLTLPALLSVLFVGLFGSDTAHLRFGYLASLTSLVGLPTPRLPGLLSSLTDDDLFPGFTHSVFAPPAVYCAKSFELIPHPVLFSLHIPVPNLAQNISSYQPWLHPLVDDAIYVPVQLPDFEATFDFNFLFILSLPTTEFKLWLFAHFLGLIALAACCPYADLFDCELFTKRRPKKTLLLTPEDPALRSTYGHPLFTVPFGLYPYPCFLAVPTTRDCLPIPNEAVDTICIHPSPSDLELNSYIPSSHSETYPNELGLRAPLDFDASIIPHDKPVDNDGITLKEAKLEDCTSGEAFRLVSLTVDGDTRNVGANDASLSVLEHIANPVIKQAFIDESNVKMSNTSHSKTTMVKHEYEESASEPEPSPAPNDTSTKKTVDQAPETISGHTQTVISKAVLNVDSEINYAEQTSETESLSKCNNLTECEVKVKRKRGCRGGVRVHKRIAARQKAIAKEELECIAVENELFEPDKDLCVTAEDTLVVLDSPDQLVAPLESDTPDLPITSEIESAGPELQVTESNTSVCLKDGKTFKPGYVRKRGCRGKKSSKKQLQLSCDNTSPIQVEVAL